MRPTVVPSTSRHNPLAVRLGPHRDLGHNGMRKPDPGRRARPVVTGIMFALEKVAAGDGPERLLISIGYAGWSAGQLEQEILANGWLTVPASTDILFDVPLDERFDAAIRLLGIDPLMLTSDVGHA